MWQSVKTTSDFGCVLLRSVLDEIPVSQMQQNILVVATAQKFQAKAPSDSACDESFPGLHPGLSMDTGRIDVGLHPGERICDRP